MTLDPAQRLVIQPISVVPSPASSGVDFHIDSEQTAWFNTVEQEVPFKLAVYPNGQDKTKQNAEIILVTAVSASTRPGTITVVEVQKGSGLGATGTAVIAVVQNGGGGLNEIQSLTVDATDGSYTLSFGGQTTIELTPDLPAAVLQSELESLSSIGSGNIMATGPVGGPYTLTFVGTLANTNVATITSDVTFLASQGMNEIQHFAVDGDGGTFRLSADGGATYTAAQVWNVSAATLQTALNGLAAIGASNCQVTFDSTTGIYTVTFVNGKACTDMVLLVADVSSLTKATTHITASTRQQDGSPARTIQTGDLAEVTLVSPGITRMIAGPGSINGTVAEQSVLGTPLTIPANTLTQRIVRFTWVGNHGWVIAGTNVDCPRFRVYLGGVCIADTGTTGANVVAGAGTGGLPVKFVLEMFDGGGINMLWQLLGHLCVATQNVAGGGPFVIGQGKTRSILAGTTGAEVLYHGRGSHSFDRTVDNDLDFTVQHASASINLETNTDNAWIEII